MGAGDRATEIRTTGDQASAQVTATVIGGPTTLLEYAGLKIIIDPTFDPPGGTYHRSGVPLVKTRGPAVPAASLGRLDLALLSHDQHDDNLDPAGRTLLAEVPLTLTTPAAAARLECTAVGLRPWTGLDLPAPAAGGSGLAHITAVPAQHGPDGTEHITGPVTGFLLRAAGLPSVYVSGDNASLDVVAEIAARTGPVDLAVLFAGAATTRPQLGALTIDSEQTVQAAVMLGARAVLPVHYDGWEHFTEDGATLRAAFEAADLSDRLLLPPFGQPVRVV